MGYELFSCHSEAIITNNDTIKLILLEISKPPEPPCICQHKPSKLGQSFSIYGSAAQERLGETKKDETSEKQYFQREFDESFAYPGISIVCILRVSPICQYGKVS